MSRLAASYINNQKYQQTAVILNKFNIELRKSLEKDLLSLANNNTLKGASYDLLLIFDLGH
jgi:hypothetical protein